LIMKILSRFALGLTLGLTWWMAAQLVLAQNDQQDNTKIYERYRAWISQQTVTVPRTDVATQPSDLLNEYRKVLAADGLSHGEIERQLRVITEQGQRLEIDRWNRILTSAKPSFNTAPNAFLVRMTRDRRPGTALDVGMGQGRNAIYLAQQGWTVTGFDPAEQAVAVAQAEAKRLGVKLTAVPIADDQFDFGKDQWDVIVLSYVGLRGLIPRIYDALKPGGMVVVEAFHRDSLKNGRIGPGVGFDTNELLKLFERFRVIQYEDAEGTGDFGLRKDRLVRIAVTKP
jgi:SAM-dependent methyltransferase